MAQAVLSHKRPPLLDYAFTKLMPDIFSHPVWVRFGSTTQSTTPKTIKGLFTEAENLEQNDPSAACQVLLICTVLQKYAGQSTQALTTIQKAQDLSLRWGLNQEYHWVLWGACAICIQLKRFQQAANYLNELNHLLSEQDDWVLADFVDIVNQTVLQQTKTNNRKKGDYLSDDKSLGGILTYTFHWFNQWGLSKRAPRSDFHTSDNGDRSQHRASSWRNFKGWDSLSLFIKGELRFNWLGIRSWQGKNRFSFWGGILNLFNLELSKQESSIEIVENQFKLPENEVISPKNDYQTETVQELENGAEVKDNSTTETDSSQEAVPFIPISVQMLGSFNITVQEKDLKLRSSRSLSLFKYLLLHHKQNTPREVLMDIFWPDATSETARNNLNVAIHNIRRALRSVVFMPVIVFENGGYGLEPNLQVWVDIEEFERCVKAGNRFENRGQMASAIAKYEAAISLYQGDFLEENPYDEWAVLDRERLRIAYLETLDRLSQIYFSQNRYAICITTSKLILSRDRCREDAHSMLMRCYNRQGQDHLALRQYQACVEALRLELDVTPAPETTKLYKLIRLHKHV